MSYRDPFQIKFLDLFLLQVLLQVQFLELVLDLDLVQSQVLVLVGPGPHTQTDLLVRHENHQGVAKRIGKDHNALSHVSAFFF